MATITKRGDLQWQCKVRKSGYPVQSRTFMYKEDAERWARQVERELDTAGFVDRRAADANTLSDILIRYQTEITPSKKGWEAEHARINVMLRDPVLRSLKMSAVSPAEIAAWRDRRLEVVSGSSVNRELNVLSGCINHARREWRIHLENPVELVKRPVHGKPRDRRLEASELDYLLDALQDAGRREDGTYKPGARNPWLEPLLKVAVETAMRRSELLSLKWDNVDLKKQTARIEDTKNGDARTVPLSRAACRILASLPRSSDRVFQTSPDALKKGFARALERAKERYAEKCLEKRIRPDPKFLQNLRFHDIRHEATSRLALKLSNVLELAAVSGHKDLRMLQRYYHPRASDLAKKLG